MILTSFALILSAILLGGMVFFSFGFAPVLFAQLDMSEVRPLLRGTFPYYYLVVVVLSGAAAAVAAAISIQAALLLLAIALSTLYARQILMHQINAATDRGDKTAFGRLHGLSVVIQVIQIGLAGWALLLLV